MPFLRQMALRFCSLMSLCCDAASRGGIPLCHGEFLSIVWHCGSLRSLCTRDAIILVRQILFSLLVAAIPALSGAIALGGIIYGAWPRPWGAATALIAVAAVILVLLLTVQF
jgi:hypothetical protein